jgi:L-lysine exporter family protein LysE/ArgO
MITSFLTGFFLGISLILAIGAQNAFVLRQGIIRQHVFVVALFCSISDAMLIFIGVTSISLLLNDFINEYSNIIFLIAGIWLFLYGVLKLKSAFRSNSSISVSFHEPTSLINTISIIFVFTFANPHVYLDTMILIGSISQQFLDTNRLLFALGASTASFVWFFSLAYGAKLLTPLMLKPGELASFMSEDEKWMRIAIEEANISNG